MVKVLKLNSISPKVNDVLDKNYEITSECDNPELILVRSAQMADYVLPESVVAIGRAGAGVNNIPHAEYAKRGVVVFNSPGANANAVKELVITALLLSCRKIIEGIKWVNSQNNAEGGVAKLVEKAKRNSSAAKFQENTGRCRSWRNRQKSRRRGKRPWYEYRRIRSVFQ